MVALLEGINWLHDEPCRRCGVRLRVTIEGGPNLCKACGKKLSQARKAGLIKSEEDFLRWCIESR
jgi:hypothetical protein